MKKDSHKKNWENSISEASQSVNSSIGPIIRPDRPIAEKRQSTVTAKFADNGQKYE